MNRLKTFGILLIILTSVASCGIISTEYTQKQIDREKSSPIEKWGWKQIEEGILYTNTHIDNKDLLIIKINPRIYEFKIYENRNRVNAKTIEQIHKNTTSLLTFNGGFFTEDFKPTGLLISNGKQLKSISNADLLNGILAINKNGEIDFFHQTNEGKFPININAENYYFAIQNGPALIDRQRRILINQDTEKMSSRTAIGVDKNNNIILIILKQSLLNPNNTISLYQFAHLIHDSSIFQDLGVNSVLNLDGGSSTGLMVDDRYFPEMEKVQNIITVKPKTSNGS